MSRPAFPMTQRFVRCFVIGNRVEFSYDTEEDLRRLYPDEIPWEDVEAFNDTVGINVFRLHEGSIVIHASGAGEL